jgi:hypothetical protein
MSTKDTPWGYVTITKGSDKGRVYYYYDDDEFDEYEYDGKSGRGLCAILYPSSFIGGGYILVPHKRNLFRPSTPEEIADHMLKGRALWSDGSGRIFRDILIADIRHAAETEDDPPDALPRDIIADTKAALEAAVVAPLEKRREALVWLGVLVKVWIELTEQETGHTPESDELREKAIKAMKQGSIEVESFEKE